VSNQRPKNLNLLTIRFPLPAIISILHRVSGLFLFLLLPLVIYGFDLSLTSQDGFQSVHDFLSKPVAKIALWLFLAPFIYHFVAGIRHLLMDSNIGIELKSGRLAANLVLIISFILIALAGVYIW
jgi:succinate dehydrogenase / fumarate reductase cytochrome b subunit